MGNPTGVRVAHQVTLASSSSPERAPVFGCRRFYGGFGGVRLGWEMMGPDTPGLRGETRPTQLSQLARVQPRGPQAAQALER